MAFVLDASVSACWAFDDESHHLATQALGLAASSEILVPALWWFEIRNLLVVNERRGRLTETQTHVFLSWMDSLMITTDKSPLETAVIGLARRHRLTIYDAVYLELAQRKSLPLATLDKKLLLAANAEGIRPLG